MRLGLAVVEAETLAVWDWLDELDVEGVADCDWLGELEADALCDGDADVDRDWLADWLPETVRVRVVVGVEESVGVKVLVPDRLRV